MILALGLIGAGAALSLAALISEFRRSRLTEPYAGLPRIPPEIQFVAAALTAAGAGLGYALRWPLSQLPAFTEWKMMGEGTYVVGTEPGNCRPLPRSRLRKEKSLVFLRPGQRRSYELAIDVLSGADEIRAAEKRIRAARNPTETAKPSRKRR